MQHMKLRLLLLITVVAIGVCAVRSIQAQDPKDGVELLRLEDVWNSAYTQGNADPLNGLLSDDLVVTLTDMKVMDKATTLAVIRAGIVKFDRYTTSDVRMRIYHDAAVVTGKLDRTRKVHDLDTEDHWRFTKVYVRQNGKWQVVAWHASTANL